jgi:MtN3 and saliva related transmembrane protein
MPTAAQFIGAMAAVCTTVSYVPQLQKCWTTGSAGDLSLYMLLVLAGGLGLWVTYGFFQTDWVVVTANSVSLGLLGVIVWFKVHEMLKARRKGGHSRKAAA